MSAAGPDAGAVRRRVLVRELLIVLTVTFGASAVRAVLRLVDALLKPEALNEQSTTLYSPQARIPWLDLGLQLTSAAVLLAWGALALYLLAVVPGPARADGSDGPAGPGSAPATGPARRGFTRGDLLHGAGLAALIGLPGLVFYVAAVHLGLSKVVVPTAMDVPWLEAPALLVWSAANAFGEEAVVVVWLVTRLRHLGLRPDGAIAASAVLRGLYHLYQGVSAGLGNLVMGVLFAWYFHRTGRWWPLVIAHFLIDAVAFVGYALLARAGWLGFLGLPSGLG
ncbi:CPBP family intramembrane glutamic endopeptidase [Corynebacterium frankenforstense]